MSMPYLCTKQLIKAALVKLHFINGGMGGYGIAIEQKTKSLKGIQI